MEKTVNKVKLDKNGLFIETESSILTFVSGGEIKFEIKEGYIETLNGIKKIPTNEDMKKLLNKIQDMYKELDNYYFD